MKRTANETPEPAVGETTTAVHPLDVATDLTIEGEGLYRGRASSSYSNRVGTFGGFISATLLKSVMLHPARLGEPVALTVNFCGPLAGGDFLLAARPVRTNRSTQHWLIELAQADAIIATATAVFALRRETWTSTEASFPQVPAAADLARLPPLARHAWTERYDMRFVKGAPLFGAKVGADDSTSVLWMRDDPPRPLDYVSLTALSDAFYGRIFIRRPRWTPFGTVSMTTYFHTDAAMLAAHGDRALLGTARALQFRNGYFDQTAELWTPQGEVMAACYQTVYYKE